jgi:hypothetical protein
MFKTLFAVCLGGALGRPIPRAAQQFTSLLLEQLLLFHTRHLS